MNIQLNTTFQDQYLRHENITSSCPTEYVNCSVKLSNNKISFVMTFMQEVKKLKINFEIHARPFGVGKYNSLRSISVDFCKLLKSNTEDAYMRSIYDKIIAGKKNHMFTKCPIAAV